MSEKNLEGMINISLEKVKGMVDSNSIIGAPIYTADGTTIIPVSKVSVGFGCGGSDFPSASPKEMFGGGKGQLILENPEEPLTCGIEIRVQPPGKQVKTITLLSGGEKAFVAIALYFAILKVHPTPFCVMDEIEAALDESNVVRFARYMRRVSGKTQFIVITHRRGTMEEADVLYGVTMQERGVSRMLSIDMNDMVKELKIK